MPILFQGVRFGKSSSSRAITEIADRVCWYNNIYPRAIYDGTSTVITYHGEPGQYDRYIMSYHHTNHAWTGPMLVVTNPDSDKGDSHGNPALIKTDDNYWHVVHAEHVATYNNERATSTNSIAAWSTQGTFGTGHTYPQLHKRSNGDIVVLTRQTGSKKDLVLYTSTDDMATWSGGTTLVDAQTADDSLVYSYSELDVTNNVLHVFMHYFKGTHNSPIYDTFPREDVYYMYQDSGGTWRDITGTALTLPLRRANFSGDLLAYSSSGNHTHLTRPVIDSNGYPYIAFTESAVVPTSPVSVSVQGTNMITRWNGSSWDTDTILASSFQDVALAIDAGDDLHCAIIGQSQNIVKLYESTDAGATWTLSQTMYNEGSNRRFWTIMRVDNAHADAQFAWFAYEKTIGNPALIYLWGANGLVSADGSLSP